MFLSYDGYMVVWLVLPTMDINIVVYILFGTVSCDSTYTYVKTLSQYYFMYYLHHTLEYTI